MTTPRRLSPRKLRAARTLYLSGFSASEIARQCWRELGYRSEKGCAQAILRGLPLFGDRPRTNAEARRLEWSHLPCAGCGCPKDERTPGCRACTSRHYLRRVKGDTRHVPVARVCAGCGCAWDEHTRGCRQCIDRRARRRKRALSSSGERA